MQNVNIWNLEAPIDLVGHSMTLLKGIWVEETCIALDILMDGYGE